MVDSDTPFSAGKVNAKSPLGSVYRPEKSAPLREGSDHSAIPSLTPKSPARLEFIERASEQGRQERALVVLDNKEQPVQSETIIGIARDGRKIRARGAVRDAVLGVLKESGKPLTCREIADKIDDLTIEGRQVTKALAILKEIGAVKSDKYHRWRVADSDAARPVRARPKTEGRPMPELCDLVYGLLKVDTPVPVSAISTAVNETGQRTNNALRQLRREGRARKGEFRQWFRVGIKAEQGSQESITCPVAAIPEPDPDQSGQQQTAKPDPGFCANWTGDPVSHPLHYTEHPSGVECIQITEHMNFCIGNAMKYLWRADLKGGAEDLRKAMWYIEREIQRRGTE